MSNTVTRGQRFKRGDETGATRIRIPGREVVYTQLKELRAAGKSLVEITRALRLQKGDQLQRLDGAWEEKQVGELLGEAAVDIVMTLCEGMEVIRQEVTQMKVRSHLEELKLSPQDLTVFVKSMRYTAEMAQALSATALMRGGKPSGQEEAAKHLAKLEQLDHEEED